MASTNTIMSMCETHQIQFNNYLIEFIKKIREILPNEKSLFTKYYHYYRKYVNEGKRLDFISEFVSYIAAYDKEISICDEGLFSEEEIYYPGKPIQLMKGIDFKLIWRHENLTEASKNSIWKYLQILYLLGTLILRESNQQKQLLEHQKEMLQNLIQNMQYEKSIKEDAAKMEQKDANVDKGFDFNSLNDLLTEDNIITQIAFEVARELNLSNAIQEPMQILQMLMGQDKQKLQEIIEKIQQKLMTKMKDKNISEAELMTQAQQMHDKIFDKLKKIPGMGNIEQLSQKITQDMEQCHELKSKIDQNIEELKHKCTTEKPSSDQ